MEGEPNVFACGARSMTNTRQSSETSDNNIWSNPDPLLSANGREFPDHNVTSLPLNKRSLLGLALEKDVIPRLILSYSSKEKSKKNSKNQKLTRFFYADEIAHLARLVIAPESEAAYRYIEHVKSEGATIESIYVDLLTPTARLLGEQWKSDLCCFTEVTIGTSRLQQLVHSLSPEFEREAEKAYENQRILFSPMPGEQHTFGLMLVEEYFRRAGWNCCKCVPKNTHDLLYMVRSLHFDVVGLSAG
ncbi:MAG: B12-binding domain-containing protein, partial [Hyphomicrobium sp.]